MRTESINLEANDIVIRIIGRSASGKTTIQEIIDKALTDNGFNVKSEYIDGKCIHPIEPRIKGLIARNTNITLHEVSANNIIKIN
jgi:predicted ATP-binding protein involved in virulence